MTNQHRRLLPDATAARLGGLFAIALCIAFALLSVPAAATPSSFSLTFEGAHLVDATLPAGLRHEGRFTASAPFCSSGRAYDVRQIDDGSSLTVWRLHTCDDGSGSFTAYMPALVGEHGGSGGWKIVEGTGSYATLRGMGTYTGTLVSGDPELYLTITYRTHWQGLVGFDADPPTVESFTATAKRLRLPHRTYALRIAVTAQDASTPVEFVAEISSGRTPLSVDMLKKTSTALGKALITLRVSPPARARSAQIALTTTDALGNASTSSRPVKLG